MFRLTAVLILVVFTSLNAIDGICCPDGCTHQEEDASSSRVPSTDGVCLLCTASLNQPVELALSPSTAVTALVTRVSATDPNDVPPDPPERPPRS